MSDYTGESQEGNTQVAASAPLSFIRDGNRALPKGRGSWTFGATH